MADIQFFDIPGVRINMNYNDFFYGDQTVGTNRRIQYSDGDNIITFNGVFRYGFDGVDGRIDAIAESVNGNTVYTAQNIAADASTFWSFSYPQNNKGALSYLTSGNDTITGTSFRDILLGGGGHDIVLGGNGRDRISGNAGVDVLDGGAGKDRLTGGAGADAFVFWSAREAGYGHARDVITDFSPFHGDVIDVSRIDANRWIGGNQFFDFIANDRFSGHAGELRVARGLVSGDTNGDAVADFQIELSNYAGAWESNFLL